MFVNVTGGISRDEGGLYPVVDTAVWAVKPVRTIGGCRRVEIASAEMSSARLVLSTTTCIRTE